MGTWFEDPLNAAWGMMRQGITAATLWPLKAMLGLSTSNIAEALWPTATMLLRHAKEGTALTDGDKRLITDKIKTTSQWKDFLRNWPDDKIVAKVEAANEDSVTLGFVEFGWSEPDLYFGLKQVDVVAKKENDIINLYIKDTYDFGPDDNPGLLGLWWEATGMIQEYPILIHIKPVVVTAKK